MTDIAPIKGLIELEDNFSSKLQLAEALLDNFTKTNQESLKAVAGAAGLVAATITAVAVATVELGKRGSDINDVRESLVHFAGDAQSARDVMTSLRQGTKETVDDFTLAKNAVYLLSTGVKLGADDFKTLGAAATVLNSRGLGETKEMLGLVSEALATGRTRALALKLGVIDTGDAEADLAKKLGVTKEQLSDAGRAEANRTHILTLMKGAVKDAGEQTRSFGEEIERMKNKVKNWFDDLGANIASSDVFKAGLVAVGDEISKAFGDDKDRMIKTIVHMLEQGAITVLGFGQAAIPMAKVIETAFLVVKTSVLAVETVIVGAGTAVVGVVELAARGAAALGIISDDAKNAVIETRQQLQSMTKDLALQAVEAANAATGHTEFDETLDKVSDTLGKVKAAMIAASQATKDSEEVVKTNTKTTLENKDAQERLNASLIDQDKVKKALDKSTRELAGIWADYYIQVAKNSGTSADQQQKDIETTFTKNVETLDKLDPLYRDKYNAFRAIANQELRNISADWESVRDRSKEALQEMADKALKTYDMMRSSGLTFSRDVLDEQLQKWRDLQDQANGWGSEAQRAIRETADCVRILDHAWVTDADIAAATISKTTIMVRTLSGELISLYEAQRRQSVGGSTDVTSANFSKALKDSITNSGWNPSATGVTQYKDPYDLARKGYSFAEILKYAYQTAYQSGPLPPPSGPRIPGFAEGGTVMVGERGPEVVRLPHGSQVYRSGTGPNDASVMIAQGAFVFNYPIMNDPRSKNEIGNLIADVVVDRLKQRGIRVN